MRALGGQHRGESALHAEKAAIAKKPKGKGRGGTKGKGTRGGTQRTLAEQAAYDFDLDGGQEAALYASMAVYEDDAQRSAACATDGRHKSGLVLHRPKRPACGEEACVCRANTGAMAGRIGADSTKVSREWSKMLSSRMRVLLKRDGAVADDLLHEAQPNGDAGPSCSPARARASERDPPPFSTSEEEGSQKPPQRFSAFCMVLSTLKRFLALIRCSEYLSSGEKRAGWAEKVGFSSASSSSASMLLFRV